MLVMKADINNTSLITPVRHVIIQLIDHLSQRKQSIFYIYTKGGFTKELMNAVSTYEMNDRRHILIFITSCFFI